jgi:glycyl-tRNA synthetase
LSVQKAEEASTAGAKRAVTMEKLVNLCKRRGIVFPASEIYGGLGSTWDYGPLGIELKRNVKEAWWRAMVTTRSDVVGLDSAILQHPRTWEASGHLQNFTDPLVDCKSCKQRFRADHVQGNQCPECGGELTEARSFNLMFKTFMGPVEDSAPASSSRWRWSFSSSPIRPRRRDGSTTGSRSALTGT